MRFTATIVALFLTLSATANAEIKEQGAYVGASLGAVSYNQNGDDLGDIETDGKEAAYGLYGGYKFMRHFALEGRYTNLGDHKLKSGDTEVGSSDFSVISLNLIGLLPLGDSDWELMAQAGLGFGSYSFEVNNAGRVTGDEPTGTIGAGVRWTPAPKITLQFSADTYRFSAKENDESIKNKFAVAQFAAQYNF